MKKKEVEIGAVYRVRWHDGSFTNVEILSETRGRGGRANYLAKNLSTNRTVVIKSAAKLREKVEDASRI